MVTPEIGIQGEIYIDWNNWLKFFGALLRCWKECDNDRSTKMIGLFYTLGDNDWSIICFTMQIYKMDVTMVLQRFDISFKE